jgi:GTPase SAR1 family protein
MLVGNKIDLEEERAVTTEEGQAKAKEWDCGFIEASAKANKNIPETFFELVHLINKWIEKNPAKHDPSKRRSKKGKCFII